MQGANKKISVQSYVKNKIYKNNCYLIAQELEHLNWTTNVWNKTTHNASLNKNIISTHICSPVFPTIVSYVEQSCDWSAVVFPDDIQCNLTAGSDGFKILKQIYYFSCLSLNMQVKLSRSKIKYIIGLP